MRHLAAQLRGQGFAASHQVVAELLHHERYSLQATVKVREGGTHADRDAQFAHITERICQAQTQGQPVISVDTETKELVGDFKNSGREWQPKGQPEAVRVCDFFIPELGRVNPCVVYDLAHNRGWVSVGTDHDIAAFAVITIRRWWEGMGRTLYPRASVGEGGGSSRWMKCPPQAVTAQRLEWS